VHRSFSATLACSSGSSSKVRPYFFAHLQVRMEEENGRREWKKRIRKDREEKQIENKET
jgi:hypothetical protein